MKTSKEIIEYLESERAKSYDLHGKSNDKQERLWHLVRAHTIEHLLAGIKK